MDITWLRFFTLFKMSFQGHVSCIKSNHESQKYVLDSFYISGVMGAVYATLELFAFSKQLKTLDWIIE